MSGEQALLYFNGIRGESGQYDLPPMPASELVRQIKESGEDEIIAELQLRYRQRMSSYLGVKGGIDAARLDQAGWGIIYAHDVDPAVRQGLRELLELRNRQAGRLFKQFDYQPGRSKDDFLSRFGAGPGPADPTNVPYYLLIVGGPESIPYRFQREMSVHYAVGRIDLASPSGYASYARTVAMAEKGAFESPRRAAFFAATHPDDPATSLSKDLLVEPLLSRLVETRTGWDMHFQAMLDRDATKRGLADLLSGREAPALLFAAGHGMSFSRDHPRRPAEQGALICSDWPGPGAWAGRGPIPDDYYFSAADLDRSTGLQGMIAFFTSSYGVGAAAAEDLGAPGEPAQPGRPQLSRLPAAMLSLERGGALAVIGQVGRTLAYSSLWTGYGAQTTAFESTIRGLLSGLPVGYAMEYFKDRHAELSVSLSSELRELMYLSPTAVDPGRLLGNWTASRDAGNFMIIGDPAVRLAVSEGRRKW